MDAAITHDSRRNAGGESGADANSEPEPCPLRRRARCGQRCANRVPKSTIARPLDRQVAVGSEHGDSVRRVAAVLTAREVLRRFATSEIAAASDPLQDGQYVFAPHR